MTGFWQFALTFFGGIMTGALGMFVVLGLLCGGCRRGIPKA